MILVSVTLVLNFLVNSFFLETIKAQDGKLFHLEYHQRRYESVLSSLGLLTFSKLQTVLNPPKDGLYRCRILYSKTTLNVTYHSYSKCEVQSLKLVYDDSIKYSQKSANREEIDKLFALRERADDILIIKNGRVTDTSIANIAFFDAQTWHTPKYPLLEGTTRKRLLDEKKIIEYDIYEKDLKHYTKVALLNAMIDFDIITSHQII